jgi:phosphoribosyl 1,2-cyclic phosphodiesterase
VVEERAGGIDTMFQFCSLASGSSGNATLLRAGEMSILIDLGISVACLERNLAELGLSSRDINALFITHAHSDHVKGLPTFLKKHKVPIYMKEHTFEVLGEKRGMDLHNVSVNFLKDELLNLGEVQVQVFRLPHQGWLSSGADDPGAHVGFKFTYQNRALGYFTDLGKMPEEIYPHIQDCDYYLLEANHDVLWQKMAKRPQGVIDRNLKSFGHLSNHQAGEILTRVLVPKRAERRTRGVMLAHLSRDCNNPILAEDTILKTFTACGVEPVEIKFAPPGRRSEVVVI